MRIRSNRGQRKPPSPAPGGAFKHPHGHCEEREAAISTWGHCCERRKTTKKAAVTASCPLSPSTPGQPRPRLMRGKGPHDRPRSTFTSPQHQHRPLCSKGVQLPRRDPSPNLRDCRSTVSARSEAQALSAFPTS